MSRCILHPPNKTTLSVPISTVGRRSRAQLIQVYTDRTCRKHIWRLTNQKLRVACRYTRSFTLIGWLDPRRAWERDLTYLRRLLARVGLYKKTTDRGRIKHKRALTPKRINPATKIGCIPEFAMETLTETRMPERVSSHRRANKPLVEKRRRARINDSLSQLKSILLQAMKQDSAQFSRLEKADILEMTVKYLRHMQRQHVSSSATSDPTVVAKYRAGFNECAGEVLKYFHSSSGVKDEVKSCLNDHLAKCLSVVNTPAPTHTEQTTFHEKHTFQARASSVSPVEVHQTTCLQPLQIQIPDHADVTSSPVKQTTTPHGLLLMPIAHSTPALPVMHVHDHSFSSRDSSPDSTGVSSSFNDFKNITNIRVHPYYHDVSSDYSHQTTRTSPSYPVQPVARMSTGSRSHETISPVSRYSPPQCAFQEEKVWRPW